MPEGHRYTPCQRHCWIFARRKCVTPVITFSAIFERPQELQLKKSRQIDSCSPEQRNVFFKKKLDFLFVFYHNKYIKINLRNIEEGKLFQPPEEAAGWELLFFS